MKARFLLVEFPIKTLIPTLNPTELKDIRSYWTEPRVQSLIPWMSRPLTWMSMVWTCLNSLMVSILWSIPWSIHQPAMPRAMTPIDTPRRLVFWPHLSATMPWKPAGLANLSNWCWVQIKICGRGLLCLFTMQWVLGLWAVQRACGKHAGSVRLLRRDPVSSKFLSGMWEPAFWEPCIYDQEGTTNDFCLLSWHQVAQYVVDFWNMKEHVLPP